MKSVKFGKKQGYGNLIVQGKVPRKYFFNLSEIGSAVIMGRFPKPDDLPPNLREQLWP
jgi:hypothetical protein